MLIVIEGVDRTGKTTLARRLAEKLGAEVIHAGPPTKPSIEEYETALDGYSPLESRHLILDRWHVGEYVWPKIFQRDTDFDAATQRHVEMFMGSRGAVVVYASRDSEKLKDELVRYNEPLKPHDLARAEKLFCEARSFAGKPVHLWDYDYSDAHACTLDDIIASARGEAARVAPFWRTCGPGFVTGTNAQVLLVGDELGPEKGSRTPPDDIPFAPYPATSGHYLMRALENWRNYSIINAHANRTGHRRPLNEVWQSFGKPAVVALGKRASLALTHSQVPHGSVPHPQYWRRFRHNELQAYASLIEEAAGV